MKKVLLAGVLALTAAMSSAQVTVTFTEELDASVDHGSVVSGATYVPGADKFLAGGATDIGVFNGTTGAKEGSLATTGITPAGLGFFGLVASERGSIYAFEAGSSDLWRWESVSDTAPVKVWDTPAFARGGYSVSKDGVDLIAFTGSGNDGPVEFYSDSFPFTTDGFGFATSSFQFVDSVQLKSKPSVTFDPELTRAYSVGDSHTQINKFVNADGWTNIAGFVEDTTWPTGIVAPGALAYDAVNNIVFALHQSSSNRRVVAFDGDTGDVLGQVVPESTTVHGGQKNGSYIEYTEGSGTVWFASCGGVNTNLTMLKYSYIVTDDSSVADWSLFEK